MARTSPPGRMGQQHELNVVVVFLASPAWSYVVGVTLAVDGGMSGTDRAGAARLRESRLTGDGPRGRSPRQRSPASISRSFRDRPG